MIPEIYDEARCFIEGLAAVKKDGKWGFINVKGETVIPFIYDGAFSFINGLAQVYEIGRFGLVDRKGNDTFGNRR